MRSLSLIHILIGKINDLLRSCEENANLRAAVQMLNYLADYTEFHFGEEEKLQEKIGYPGIAEHKAMQEELRKTVEELHGMLEDQEGDVYKRQGVRDYCLMVAVLCSEFWLIDWIIRTWPGSTLEISGLFQVCLLYTSRCV